MTGRTRRQFPFVANLTWLDFVNTEVVSRGEPRDLLRSAGDLVAWVRESGAWEGTTLRRLETGAGDAVFGRAVTLRRRLRGLAAAAAADASLPGGIVQAVNRVLSDAPIVDELVPHAGGLIRRRRPATDDPIYLLLPVAESVAAFLAGGDPRLVKQCGAPDCILFFYDTSKSHRRRWCSMASCGNRAKAAAFQRRRRGSAKVGGGGD